MAKLVNNNRFEKTALPLGSVKILLKVKFHILILYPVKYFH